MRVRDSKCLNFMKTILVFLFFVPKMHHATTNEIVRTSGDNSRGNLQSRSGSNDDPIKSCAECIIFD